MSNLSQAKENLKIEKNRLKKAKENGDDNAVGICQGNIKQLKKRIKDLEKSEKKGKKSKSQSQEYSSSNDEEDSKKRGCKGCLTAPFRLIWWLVKKLFLQ